MNTSVLACNSDPHFNTGRLIHVGRVFQSMNKLLKRLRRVVPNINNSICYSILIFSNLFHVDSYLKYTVMLINYYYIPKCIAI